MNRRLSFTLFIALLFVVVVVTMLIEPGLQWNWPLSALTYGFLGVVHFLAVSVFVGFVLYNIVRGAINFIKDERKYRIKD